MSLSSINKHPRDDNIRFVEETHEYFINGSKEGYISTTTLVHSLFEHFDADNVIEKMRKSKNWNKYNKYFNMSNDEIKKLWEDNRDHAATAGTKMHLNIEKYYNNEDHEKDSKEFSLFQMYLDETNYNAFRTEWVIYDEESKISGSVDMVYKDPLDGKYIIADWKRSKEIKMSNRWQSGNHPITHDLDDCNFIHYSLQLYIYKAILEKNYGIVVKDCFLVILHPSQEKYIKITTRNMEEYVKKIINMRTNVGTKINYKNEITIKHNFDMSKLKF